MALFSPADAALARSVSKIVFCNPFLPERIDAERDALGADFNPSTQDVWNASSHPDAPQRANVLLLQPRVEDLASRTRKRLVLGPPPTDQERELYQDLIHYLLYYRIWDPIQDLIEHPHRRRLGFYEEFQAAVHHFLVLPGVTFTHVDTPEHLLALYYQVARAFMLIFTHLAGGSLPAAELRASVWQSIFTHDLRRYHRGLYRHLGDIPTLITGPSGTGKELVARAIAFSRYIPFDPVRGVFAIDVQTLFYPLNLAALSPTLIESELFGHRRAAFTGAVEDRVGWVEACPSLGSVFLDEIGEIDGQIQIKLLRVLQTRTFQRLGETEPRRFNGKIIAATNRDLAVEMKAGRFRTDFYYRLCADQIVTPGLRQQLEAAPDELPHLVSFVARRIAGEHAASLTGEVVDWIQGHMDRDYPWPGNFRELEQCVRNIMIRKSYHPPRFERRDQASEFASAFEAGDMTAEELLSRYCRQVYQLTGSYDAAARRLGLDRRTVKAKVLFAEGES